MVERYRNKISGPLLDRIDLHVKVNAVPIHELQEKPAGESSLVVRARVLKARKIQLERQHTCNNELQGQALETHCFLNDVTRKLLAHAMDQLQLSARAYNRILRVARTIADLEGGVSIQSSHISEALAYRNLDRPI